MFWLVISKKWACSRWEKGGLYRDENAVRRFSEYRFAMILASSYLSEKRRKIRTEIRTFSEYHPRLSWIYKLLRCCTTQIVNILIRAMVQHFTFGERKRQSIQRGIASFFHIKRNLVPSHSCLFPIILHMYVYSTCTCMHV